MIGNTGFYFLIGYILLLFGVGWYSGRKQTKEGFLLADREVGAFSSAMSILATKIGGGTLLAFVAYVYIFGTTAIWYVFGLALGYFLFYFFSLRLKEKADANKWYSLLDYAKSVMKKPLFYGFSGALFFAFVLMLVIQFIGAGTILKTGFGMSLNVSIIIVAAVVLIYLLIGGFKAVVATDVIQAGSFLVFLTIIMAGLWSSDALTSPTEKMPVAMAVALSVVGVLYPFSSHDLWQRVFATKKKSLPKAIIGAGTLYFFVGIILVLLGLAILNLMPGADPEMAVVLSMGELLDGPMQIVGLLAFFAVILSSADTMLFSTASMLVQDFLNPKKVTDGLKKAFTVLTLSAVVVAIIAGSLINVAIIYASVLVFLGAVIFCDWMGVSMETKRATRSFYLTFAILIGAMIATGLLESMLLIGPAGYPLFIGLQKLFGI